jgi:hypothetical protein
MNTAFERHASYRTASNIIFLDQLIAAADRAMPRHERRLNQRRPCQASIAVKTCRSGERQRGRVYNISRSGMYFESDAFLRPGSSVSISGEISSVVPHLSKQRAEVVWCQEILDAVVIYNYAVGVRFIEPIPPFRARRNFKVISGGAEDHNH